MLAIESLLRFSLPPGPDNLACGDHGTTRTGRDSTYAIGPGSPILYLEQPVGGLDAVVDFEEVARHPGVEGWLRLHPLPPPEGAEAARVARRIATPTAAARAGAGRARTAPGLAAMPQCRGRTRT